LGWRLAVSSWRWGDRAWGRIAGRHTGTGIGTSSKPPTANR